MELKDLLQLEASYNSINLINDYLKELNYNSYDYSFALAHLAYINYSLGNDCEAFNLIHDYINKCEDRFKPIVFDSLIKIYYENNDYDNVIKSIETKANYLSSDKRFNYYEDLIKFYETIGDNDNLIKVLITYLQNDTRNIRRIKALNFLCNLCIKTLKYDLFNENISSLKSLALRLNKKDIYQEACYNEAKVLTKTLKYEEALQSINNLLDNDLSISFKVKVIILKVEVLIGLNELEEASIFVKENESVVDLGPVDAKIKFALVCIELYKKLENNDLVNSYQEKLEQLENLRVNESKSSNKVLEKTFTPLIESYYNYKNDEINANDILNLTKEEKSLVYDSVSNFFKKVNNLNETIHENLRLFFLYSSEYIDFDECFLFYKNKQYHYKKERLYAKNLDLSGSITMNTYNRMEDNIIFDTKDTSFRNPITNILYKNQDNLSAISLPLKNGAITFISKNYDLINKGINFETIKLISTYLETIILKNESINESINRYKAYMNFIDNKSSGIKFIKDNYITLSKEAALLLGIKTTDTIPSYLLNLDNNDVIKYRQILNDLTSGKINEASIIYKFNGKDIYEEFKTNDDEIYSIVKDAKDIILKNKEEDFKANYDPIAKAYNRQKLVADLKIKIKTGRFSIFYLVQDDYQKYFDLYGKDFANDLAYAICKFLSEYPQNKLNTYYYGENSYIFIIDEIVDKRTISNIAIKIEGYLHDKLYSLNNRVDSKFKMGILRYPTDTMKQNITDIINELLLTITGEDIAFYDLKVIKNRMFESQLQTFISEAIDNNELKLYYTIITDLLNDAPYAFKARINLSNYSVPEDKIFEVAKKRHMIPMIERYLIHRGMFELKELYDKVKLPYKFIFNISKETLFASNIVDYIESQKEFFKVPNDRFIIAYNDSIDDNVIKVLKSIKVKGFMLMTSNDIMLKNVLVNAFLFNSNNMNENLGINYFRLIYEYCNSLNIDFIIGNINKIEDISVYSVYGVKYYTGPYYKRKLSIDVLKDMVEE